MSEAERIVAARKAQTKQEAEQREESLRQELIALIELLAPHAVANIVHHNYPTGDMLLSAYKCYTDLGGEKRVVWGSPTCGVDEHGVVVFYNAYYARPHATLLHEYTRTSGDLRSAANTLHHIATRLVRIPVPSRADCDPWQCDSCRKREQHYDYPFIVPEDYPVETLRRVLGIQIEPKREKKSWWQKLTD